MIFPIIDLSIIIYIVRPREWKHFKLFFLQGEYFRCPPPIISIFGYVIEDRKIRNTCFFIFPRFHIWGVKTVFKVRVEKSFLWNISRTIRGWGIVSMDEFCVFECEI